MRVKEKALLDKAAYYQNHLIDYEIPKLVRGLKQAIKERHYDFIFDLNKVISKSKESLFTHHWIHCNARGNVLCADYVYKILWQKGIV